MVEPNGGPAQLESGAAEYLAMVEAYGPPGKVADAEAEAAVRAGIEGRRHRVRCLERIIHPVVAGGSVRRRVHLGIDSCRAHPERAEDVIPHEVAPGDTGHPVNDDAEQGVASAAIALELSRREFERPNGGA